MLSDMSHSQWRRKLPVHVFQCDGSSAALVQNSTCAERQDSIAPSITETSCLTPTLHLHTSDAFAFHCLYAGNRASWCMGGSSDAPAGCGC